MSPARRSRNPNRKRRAKGSGSLYQTKQGLWRGVINRGIDPTTHKRMRLVVSGKTQREAADKLTALQARHNAGGSLPIATDTVAEYLERWLARQQAKNNGTYHFFETKIRKQPVPHIGTMKLKALTPVHVDHLINTTLPKDGLSPRTRAHARDVLRAALNTAIKTDKILIENPAAALEVQGLREYHPDILDQAQARKFLQAAETSSLRALFELAISTGMRQGELLGMRWKYLDLAKGTYTVRQQLQRQRGAGPTSGKTPQDGSNLKLVDLKTESSHRTLRLPQRCIEALEKHRQEQERIRPTHGRWNPDGLIFVMPSGIPIQPSRLIRDFFHPICDEAGIARTFGGTKGFTFHGLRHTAATLMLEAGLPERIVMGRLGHAGPTQTHK